MSKQRKEKRYEFIFRDICERIERGELKPGDKLPTEEEMTGIYGVSRITVTHAMTELKNNNIVLRTTRKGTFVNRASGTVSLKKQLLIPLVLPLPEEKVDNRGISDGIKLVAAANRCVVPMHNTENNPIKEVQMLKKILRMHPDGLLIYPCTEYQNVDILSQMLIKKIPVVFIDRKVEGIDSCVVKTDNRKAMSGLVQKLIDLGHRKIACAIPYVSSSTPETERFEGYCDTLIKNGIAINADYLLSSENFREKYDKLGRSKRLSYVQEYSNWLLKKYLALKDKPTVICCANDNDALNLRVTFEKVLGNLPDNPTVTGFDNIKFNIFTDIPTVEQDYFNIGKTAIEIAIQLINGQPLITKAVNLNGKILPKSIPDLRGQN